MMGCNAETVAISHADPFDLIIFPAAPGASAVIAAVPVPTTTPLSDAAPVPPEATGIAVESPEIEPPVIATLLAFWLDIVPRAPATFCTKAVVAICVVLVPANAVGAVGVPVNTGLTEEIAPENVAVDAVNAPVKAVVPVTDRLPLITWLPKEPVDVG